MNVQVYEAGGRKFLDGMAAERDAVIPLLYADGLTMQAIGDLFGITRERVRQILNAQNGRPERNRHGESARSRREMVLARVREKAHASLVGGSYPDEIAADLGIPVAWALLLLRELPHEGRREHTVRSLARRRSTRTGDADILNDLFAAAGAVWPNALTAKSYDEWARAHGALSHQTAILRFGCWSAALHEAGVASTPRSKRGKWTREKVLAALSTVIPGRFGYFPSAFEYDCLARESNGELPSLATVRAKVGRWSEILEVLNEQEV